MSSYFPISLTVPQYVDSNGDPYSGAVLKAYADGTTTNISMATDSTGGTTATSIALNSNGYPEVSGSIVIPHINQDYKLSLYPTQTAADADTGDIWTIDSLSIGVFHNIRQLSSVAGTNTITATASPTLGSYTANDIFIFTPANANTGAVTLNIDSVGAGAVQLDGAALVGGELIASVPVIVQCTAATPVFEILGSNAGSWVTPTFSAGDYTASGSMTWTVASGDVTTYAYHITGKTMKVAFTLGSTTVGGTPSNLLKIAIPASKVASSNSMVNPVLIIDNGSRTTGYATIQASGTTIDIARTDAANYTASTDNTDIRGEITFEIT